MPIGAGACSVGNAIAGYGGVDAAPIQQPNILIDAVTGLAQNARKVDPNTGRYVLDQYGRVQGMSGIQQMVEVRAGTLLNSSAVANLGLAAPSGTIGPNIVARLTNEIMAAMQDIIDLGYIQVVKVQVSTVPGSKAFHRFFTWKDLTATGQNAGIEQKTNF